LSFPSGYKFFSADGFFTIVGRKKEIIITAGKTAEKDSA
jgi:hypothetical protein